MTHPRDAIGTRTTSGREFTRYVAVGVWNTAFGYGVFAGFNWLLTGLIPYPFLCASVLSNAIAISVAFLLYKRVVFRTTGNTFPEFLRVNIVYIAIALAGLVLLPLAVRFVTPLVSETNAPYVAQALLIPLATLASYAGHRRYSFKRTNAKAP